MMWNYPREFRCSHCNGSGEMYCTCCENEVTCSKCDGGGLVGVDLTRMHEAIRRDAQSRTGVWELVENEIWVGRTDGKHKWYYRDYATPARKENGDE